MKKFTFLLAAVLCAAMSFAGTFVKTDLANIKSTDVVLIVATTQSSGSYAMSNDKAADAAPTAVAVTVSGTSIETTATNILWNITYNATASTFTVNVAGGTKKLYCTTSNNGVRVGSGDANTFKINNNYIYNTTQQRYLGVYDKQDWRCYTSSGSNIANQSFAFYVAVPVPATGIALDKTTLTLEKGATEQLTATLTPADATTAVVWATDNDAVATVANGLVTAVGVGTANITATVTPAEGTSYTATCVVTVVTAPDAPTFTVTDELFEGSMNVAIAAADGMKIYYTTNGDEPTTASTEYTAPFEITATTTVKAIAYDEANTKASVVAEKTYTKALTCAEANTAANGTVINLNTVTVVYVNGSNIYVADATGGALIYKYGYGLEAGQVVKGLKGSISIYNQLPEIVPSVEVADLTITEGTAPAPTVITAVPTMANISQYVRINGVTTTAATWSSSDKDAADRTLVAKLGADDLTLYNTFKIDQTFAAGNYNIVGFVTCYNTTVQIAVVSAERIYTISATANDEAMGTVTGAGEYAENAEVTLTATANDGYEFVNWTNAANETIGTEATLTFTATQDSTIKANFKAEEPLTPATWYGQEPLTGTIEGTTKEYSIVYEITRNADKTLTVKYTINEADLTGLSFLARNLIDANPSTETAYLGKFENNTDGGYILTTTKKFKDGDVLSLKIYMVVKESSVPTNNYTEVFNYTVGSSNTKPAATYTITTTVNDEAMGTVTGAGEYAENAEVTLTAKANDGYEFVNWTNAANETIGTEATLTFIATQDSTIKANFKAQEPLAPATWYGQEPLTGTVSGVNYSLVYEITRNSTRTLTFKLALNDEAAAVAGLKITIIINNNQVGYITENFTSGVFTTSGYYTDDDELNIQFYLGSNNDGVYASAFKYIVGSSNNKPTAIDSVSAEAKATKRIVNGVLVIEKNGVRYNAQGVVME